MKTNETRARRLPEGVEVTGYTVKGRDGWKAAIRIVDRSAIPFIGKPLIRRRIFGLEMVCKEHATERSKREAASVLESGVIP